MSMKRFGTYSLRVCVGLLSISIFLMPIQATEAVPIPAQKPDISLNQNTLAISEKTKEDVKTAMNVPVPEIKPVFDIEPAAGSENAHTYEPKLLNLTALLPAANAQKDQSKRTEQFAHGYKPLSSHQSRSYAKVFKLQLQAKWDIADVAIKEISDDRLMGHVLYQRYMHPHYKSSFTELKSWLDQYASHPYAEKIHKLALARQGDDTSDLKAPESNRILSQIKEPTIYYPKKYVPTVKRTNKQNRQVRNLSRKVRALVRTGKTQEALNYLQASETKTSMDTVEIDQLKSVIASGFLYRGNVEQAQQLAVQAVQSSGKYVPTASWVAGLSLWQKHDFINAATYFEKTGRSAYASGWRSSAGYYWAARSHSRAGQKEKLRTALNNAAKHSRTFYGLIAIKILDKSFDFNWNKPKFTYEQESLVLSTDAGQRAFSLVAAGQYDLAEDELMRLNYTGNMALRQAVLSYAMHVGLPGIALRLGNMVQAGNGKYYDSALYPATPWEPQDGFMVDPALVYAVMRQESRFNQHAKSYSGALGLMQLMPKTAQYIAKKKQYPQHINAITLSDPAINMTVGQDYLEYLIKGKYVRGDIVSLLIAYNAGPGNLLKWRKRRGDISDPLLFIETLPVQETRDYVAKVLSNYWIYRLREGLDVPSLASLAGGKSPRYAHAVTMPDTYKVSSTP